MPKTQKQLSEELQQQLHKDRKDETKIADKKERIATKGAIERAAARLPGMPGPKPGGLAEAMADPTVLQQSLERNRQRREEYENAKVAAGIKDTRLPAKTPGNAATFAEGATAKPGARMTVNGNPRFAPGAPTRDGGVIPKNVAIQPPTREVPVADKSKAKK